MAIGKNLNLQEMLKHSLLAYLRKLNCISGIVYQLEPQINDSYRSKPILSIPPLSLMNGNNELIKQVIPKSFSKDDLDNYCNQLPITGKLNSTLYYHIMQLDQFGFLVLIKNGNPLSREIIYTLRDINQKLALASLACINNKNIKESQEKARKIGDSALDAVIMIDSKGNVDYWNDAAVRIFGYQSEEVHGRYIHNIIMPKKYNEQHYKGWEIFQKSGKGNALGKVLELSGVRKSGEEFPVEIALSSIHLGDGYGAVAYIRDISIRKKAEKALEESEKKLKRNAERLELALTGSHSGLWDWNITTGEVFVNERWCTMLGYRLEEIKPHISSWEKLVHPDDMPMIRKALAQHLAGKISLYKTEHRMKTKTGEWKWILDTGKVIQRDQEGKPVRAVGTHIDITEKKRYEFILQQNLEQQELLSEISLESNRLEDFDIRMNRILSKIGENTQVSRVYIFEDNESGKATSNTYEWCNSGIIPQKEELQNVPYEMLPSFKTLLKEKGFLYSENIQDLPQDIRAILEPQNIKSIVIYPLWVKGQIFGFIGFDECTKEKHWNKTELELLRTISGVIANTFERKVMEKSIIDERNKANRANQAKSEFLANMSHEIRTPLNAILGFSDSLLQETEDRQHQKVLSSILSSGRLLLSLINDILDLSKIESGRLEISPHPTNLREILEEIRLLFIEKARKKGIELHNEIPAIFPETLRLDELRIKQVIFNLLSNAIKFTHKGYVSVRLNYQETEENKGILTIEVSDTGIGIPEKDQAKIFKSFVQQSSETNRLYQGSGLGLAISKRLINKMNGTIHVKSIEGKGSTFSVILNDVEPTLHRPLKNGPKDEDFEYQFDQSSVMVVDDVDTNVEMAERLLRKTNIQFFSARDGNMALEILKHRQPDILLLDIRMPGLSGYEVAEKIKRNPATSSIPIIAFTASVFSMNKIESSPYFDGFLFKPVRRIELFQELAKFLPHQKQKQTNKKDQQDNQWPFLQEEYSLSDSEIRQLTPLLQIVETTFLPRWEQLKSPVVFYKIEEFARNIKTTAKQYQNTYLESYSDQLLEDIEAFDVENLNQNLLQFETIIEKLKKYSPNKHSNI
jgi:PAS domain S-box-containing protein